ncbi:dTDP-4-dehydrorhamnose 3,5-epimerase [Chromobacterium sinusclupearum]|uniref:dTDP-4-dehydrorhamnose 3,5-epimerase n=1 Tax=Chromobacterium sinusclupearum TaxID=2077146 RepID=A0A2K4MRT2_9NEIS|nr:dTDP-4-dehydrorhamnose 3,5-epimerase [Chromobacterium sinusclupearum]POA99689.1 dTDP-4-dehydrorhamnose 3,5-epimerase [Chromobacterium sinusclupearum]
MSIISTAISDVKIIEPTVFGDNRGFFFESFNQQKFNSGVGYEVKFVQDNHSCSHKGVLRGLHYQLEPHAQGKLVHVIAGSVFDVSVDIRPNSPTFGQWVGVELSADNKRQLWIPPGFAHGFLTLSDDTEFLYKTTDYWFKDLERTIAWNDPTLAIDWPLQQPPVLSPKDQEAPLFTSLGA